MQKKKLVEEKIHFVYIYTDGEGKEICRVDIGPDEFSKI